MYHLTNLWNSPSTGVFSLAAVSPRQLPSLDASTQECVHPSVLEQGDQLRPALRDYLSRHPELIHQLTPMEEEWKCGWPYDPNSPQAQRYKLGRLHPQKSQTPLGNGAAPVSTDQVSKRRSLIIKFMRATGLSKEVTITSVTQTTQRRFRSEAWYISIRYGCWDGSLHAKAFETRGCWRLILFKRCSHDLQVWWIYHATWPCCWTLTVGVFTINHVHAASEFEIFIQMHVHTVVT